MHTVAAMNLVLKKFTIFDISEGQDEGREWDKLLYHWTKDAGDNGKVDMKEQIDDICLCDASIGASIKLSTGLGSPSSDEQSLFMDSQSSCDPCEPVSCNQGRHLVLTFEYTVIVMVEVEPTRSIWIAVYVSQAQHPDSDESISRATTSPTFDTDNIPTHAIRQIIWNIYTRFCLINGTFQMLKERFSDTKTDPLSKENLANIRNKTRSICDTHFNSVLPEVHLSSIIYNIASLYNQITYLDLNPLTLMKVTSFINHLVCLDPRQIRYNIAIFNDKLLWSTLNAYDSRLVYNYMTGVLIRNALQEELSRETEKVRRICENMPIYLTESCDNVASNMSALRLDAKSKPLTRFSFTVFRSSNNLTLGIIIKDSDQFDLINRCEQVLTSDSRLGVIPLASLAKSVGQSFIKSANLANTSASSQSSQQSGSTFANRQRISTGNASSSKNTIPADQKFLCIDYLDHSVTSSFNMDAPTRDLIHRSDGHQTETVPLSRKMRLVKYMIDLEPEMQDIERIMDGRVDEYFVKTVSDTWLTVVNSKYRRIYSIYKMRNAGLSEAQQAANNLKLALLSSRP